MSWFHSAGSAEGTEVDYLLMALLSISLLVLALVFGLMLTYIVRYRWNSELDRGELSKKSWIFEVTWTSVTLVIFFGLFVWGADLYMRRVQPPADALKIWVVGKQWMWKIEHAGGQREINALHVPVGRAVELIMTSEDVIHDFSLPSMRIKRDVLPGRYETMWFRSDHTGSDHIFCTQFCGTDHAAMIGEIDVMSQHDYADWLAGQGTNATLAKAGQELFIRFGCDGCHSGRGTVRAPPLEGVYGSPVPLSDGSVVTADERYLRNAILAPAAQIVASYPNVMPSYSGRIGEDDLIKLIAYMESLGGKRSQE